MKAHPIKVGTLHFATIRDAATHFGIPYMTVARRLRTGWTVRQALGLEHRRRQAIGGRKLITSAGTFPSVKAAAEHFGFEPATVVARLLKGWTNDEAVGLAEHQRRPREIGDGVMCEAVRYPNSSQLAKAYGKSTALVLKRLRSGWSPEQAVGLNEAPPRFRNQVGGDRGHKYRHIERVDGKDYPLATPGQYKVYLITNMVTSKQYVGITISSLADRLRGHFSSVQRGAKSPLYNAMRKYGRHAFKIELIRNDAKNFADLQAQEIEEIQRRKTIGRGYNVSLGGALGTPDPITVAGRKFASHAEAAQHHGVSVAAFNLRLGRLKWTPEEAAGLAPRAKFARRQIDVAGKTFPSLKSAAEHLRMDYKLVHDRVVNKGWTVAQALGMYPPPASAKFAGLQVKIGRKAFQSIAECARWYGIKPQSLSVRMWKYGQTAKDAVAHLRSKPKAGARGMPVTAFGKRFTSLLACAEHHGLHSASLQRRMSVADETVEQAVTALKKSKRVHR